MESSMHGDNSHSSCEEQNKCMQTALFDNFVR